MNKKKSKVLAFLLATAMLVPMADGTIYAATDLKVNREVSQDSEEVQSVENTHIDKVKLDSQVRKASGNEASANGVEYPTLKEALEAGGEVKLLRDVEVNEIINITKDTTLDLGDFTITDNAAKRPFVVEAENFTIKANKGGMVIPESNTGAYGFVEAYVKNFKILGGNYSGDTDNGRLFRINTTSDIKTGTLKVDGIVANTNNEIIGHKGTFSNYSGSITNSELYSDTRAIYFDIIDTTEASTVTIENTKAIMKRGPVVEMAGGNAILSNNDWTVTGDYSGGYSWARAAVGVGYRANVTIKSGNYIADSDKMKSNEGYGVYIYSSGGTVNIEGGNFAGTTASLRADVDKDTYNNPANIIVNDGEFKGDLLAATKTGIENITINGGKFTEITDKTSVENNNLTINNGKFDKDLKDFASEEVKLTSEENVDGSNVFGYYTNMKKAVSDVEDGATISIHSDLTENLTEDINIDKNITIDVPKGKTLTLTGDNALNVSGNLNISGTGNVIIDSKSKVNVENGANLNLEKDTKLENNGVINNSGTISNSGTLTNNKGTVSNSGNLNNENGTINNSENGTISNSGKLENGSNGNITNSGVVANVGNGSTTGKDVVTEGNGQTITDPNSDKIKPIDLEGANKISSTTSITIDAREKSELGEVEYKIEKASKSAAMLRNSNIIKLGEGWKSVDSSYKTVTFTGLEANTEYVIYARYGKADNTIESIKVSTLSNYVPSIPSKPSKPTYTYEEIIGSDRYDTAAKIADKLGSYDNVVLVNASSTMSDGLSASGLAGKENGAILLTKKDSIPKVTMDRIKKVKKVYIIGGESAISAKVANEITASGIKVERLGGKTRVETSEIVAEKLGNYNKAFVVNGFKGEADAMSASAVAAKNGAPILLTNGKTSTHAKKSNVEYYVIGGNNVVDKSIATKYDAEVLAGKDRYATNREVIDEFYSGSDKLYLANGDKLVDALTASPLAKNHGIVLVNKKSDKSILKDKNTVQVGGMDFEIEFEK